MSRSHKRPAASRPSNGRLRVLRFSTHAIERIVERFLPGRSYAEALRIAQDAALRGSDLRAKSAEGDAQTEVELAGARAVLVVRRDGAGAICTTVLYPGEPEGDDSKLTGVRPLERIAPATLLEVPDDVSPLGAEERATLIEQRDRLHAEVARLRAIVDRCARCSDRAADSDSEQSAQLQSSVAK